MSPPTEENFYSFARGDSERREQKEAERDPEPLTGKEVADLVERIFDKLSPDLRCRLVDSNAVLALAGLKPTTHLYVPVTTDADVERFRGEIITLNAYLEDSNSGVRFRLAGRPFNPTGRDERLHFIVIDSLRGYEHMSKTVKIPGVPPFNRRDGWEKFGGWFPRMIEGIKQAQAAGQLPQGPDVLTGWNLGYPEAAIRDEAEWVAAGKKRQVQDSRIPYTELYNEASPNYFFYPEHENDPGIQANIQQAGNILKEFYESQWHQKASPSLAFHRKTRT